MATKRYQNGKVIITDNSKKVISGMEALMNGAIRMIGEQVVVESTPITPRKTGDLRHRVDTASSGQGKVRVVWSMEYAAAQEKGIVGKGHPVRNYTEAGTGKGFAQKGVERAVKKGEAIIKRAMKGGIR